ncbi:hypothetical protein [Myxacorys almedinensis]|uniref:Phage protein D n=1 Tax=Myxacorys almedinensis A TaxID=2690445 RepID=A0A8J7ZBP1_9CYAN|nr:hypothetical protein [Myxacorys almedinensis]NDJ19005.1 hypothetical protein [Myxacorys almedinensis A]
MFTPAYKLTIGRKVIDTTSEPQASTIVDLMVNLDLNTPSDRFILVLGQVGRFKPNQNDDVKLELGYADGDLTQVIEGKITTVEPGLTTNRIIGYSVASELLRTFVDETFEGRTAGAIARELAGRASVEVAIAEDGILFPGYVIDGQRSIYHHIYDLAVLCGFDFYINAEGELVFKKFINGNRIHIFEYAKHVLSLDVLKTPPRATSVEAWGESPGGSRGEQAWVWLTRDFSNSKVAVGSGNPKLLLERSTLRTRDAARMAADAALTAIGRRTLRGKLLALGRAEVTLGDSIRLRDVPDSALNETFQVRSVTHHITKQRGFTTAIEFQSLA